MGTRSRGRGFSLIELIVYSSILSALLGGIYLLLVAGMRYFRTGEIHQRVSQEAAVAMRRICLELSNSTPPSLNTPVTSAIIFLSPDQPYPGAGNWTYAAGMAALEYKKWVCIYRDAATNTLRRCEDGGPSTNPPGAAAGLPAVVPPLPAVPALATLQAIGAPRQQLLARSILSVQFQLDGADRVVVDLSASEETGSRTGQVTSVTLHSRVFVKN